MTIDNDSIAKVRAARARIDELERALELARSGYHETIRVLHEGGASLRELASGLGISHQRVHQIIEAAPAAVAAPVNASTSVASCDFCGEARTDDVPFVPGPGVGICEACVNAAESAVDGAFRGPSGVFFSRADPNAKEHCAFCKKSARQVNRLVETDDLAVCDECLGRCRTILTQKAAARTTV